MLVYKAHDGFVQEEYFDQIPFPQSTLFKKFKESIGEKLVRIVGEVNSKPVFFVQCVEVNYGFGTYLYAQSGPLWSTDTEEIKTYEGDAIKQLKLINKQITFVRFCTSNYPKLKQKNKKEFFKAPKSTKYHHLIDLEGELETIRGKFSEGLQKFIKIQEQEDGRLKSIVVKTESMKHFENFWNMYALKRKDRTLNKKIFFEDFLKAKKCYKFFFKLINDHPEKGHIVLSFYDNILASAILVVYVQNRANYLFGLSTDEGVKKDTGVKTLFVSIVEAKRTGCLQYNLDSVLDKKEKNFSKFKYKIKGDTHENEEVSLYADYVINERGHKLFRRLESTGGVRFVNCLRVLLKNSKYILRKKVFQKLMKFKNI